jgi:hypothetical protein
MASWPASDDGRPYAAPVLLMPVTIEQTGTDRRRLTLTRAGELQPNLVLLHHLESQKVSVDAGELIDLVEGDDHEEDFDLEPAFRYLTAASPLAFPSSPSPRTSSSATSRFRKWPWSGTCASCWTRFVQHDIVAAMARDAGASAALRTAGTRANSCPTSTPYLRTRSSWSWMRTRPSSGQWVTRCWAGMVVIAGPPGTGKSQTIANLNL